MGTPTTTVREFLNSLRRKADELFDTLYLKYKGEKYRKKIAAMRETINELLDSISDQELDIEHLKKIEAYIEEISRKNKYLTIAEILFSVYHLIEIILHFFS